MRPRFLINSPPEATVHDDITLAKSPDLWVPNPVITGMMSPFIDVRLLITVVMGLSRSWVPCGVVAAKPAMAIVKR